MMYSFFNILLRKYMMLQQDYYILKKFTKLKMLKELNKILL